MGAPTNKDWGKIHAMAWRDPAFRTLLETDPKKAVAKYGKQVGKTFDKLIKVRPRPKGVSDAELNKHADATTPPACC